jgi:FkbM family methyltransferase
MTNPLLSLAALAARLIPLPLKRALYRSGPLAEAIRRLLNRAAPRGFTEIQVAGGGLVGAKLSLDLQEEKDYWLGTYETDLQAAIRELVLPGMVAYDVGANIGYISLLLARAVGPHGRVIAFEALPANVERLRLNLAVNPEGERVHAIHAAVTDSSREVRFLVGPSGGMGKAEGSAGRQAEYARSITVPGLALDDFTASAAHPLPQVIKIDIEGGEVLALPGMQRLLADTHPLVLMELHGPEAAHAAWDTLTALGYTICRMAPGFPVVNALEDLDWKAYVVAGKKQPGVLSFASGEDDRRG